MGYLSPVPSCGAKKIQSHPRQYTSIQFGIAFYASSHLSSEEYKTLHVETTKQKVRGTHQMWEPRYPSVARGNIASPHFSRCAKFPSLDEMNPFRCYFIPYSFTRCAFKISVSEVYTLYIIGKPVFVTSCVYTFVFSFAHGCSDRLNRSQCVHRPTQSLIISHGRSEIIQHTRTRSENTRNHFALMP